MKYRGDGADYLPMDYDDPLDISIIRNREVFVLDFSFPVEIMKLMFVECSRVVWIDHHKGSFEKWCGSYFKGDRYEPTPGTRYSETENYMLLDDNRSGAWLAWEFFHNPKAKIDIIPPTLFMLLDDRDRWVFKLTKSREVHAALLSMRPWSMFQWSTMTIPDLIELGDKIINAYNVQIADAVESARRIELPGGYIGMSANSTVHYSEVGHKLAELSKTFGLVWSVDKLGRVWVNLRSMDDYMDVQEIARKFGGDGHRNAAGFKTTIENIAEWLR